jgi:hypothetical protein
MAQGRETPPWVFLSQKVNGGMIEIFGVVGIGV